MSQDSKYIEELRRKIAASFEAVRQPTPASKPIDEKRIREQREEYAKMLFKSALRQLDAHR
jgi:hypothetical protein